MPDKTIQSNKKTEGTAMALRNQKSNKITGIDNIKNWEAKMFLESLRITARKKDYKQDSERDVLLETTVPDTKTTEQSFFFF